MRRAERVLKLRERDAVRLFRLGAATLLGVEFRQVPGEDAEVGVPLELVFRARADRLDVILLRLFDPPRGPVDPRQIVVGLKLGADGIGAAERTRGAVYHSIAGFFDDYDILVSPTVMTPPFDVDIRYLAEFDGVAFDTYIRWLALTYVITLTSCPAISIPCGFTASGLPVGLQIVAPARAEAALLSAAALFEDAAGIAATLPIDPR